MKCLKEFGFSDEECEKALDQSNGDLTEAALWLTQHGKPLPVEKKTNQQNLTCIEVYVYLIYNFPQVLGKFIHVSTWKRRDRVPYILNYKLVRLQFSGERLLSS